MRLKLASLENGNEKENLIKLTEELLLLFELLSFRTEAMKLMEVGL